MGKFDDLISSVGMGDDGVSLAYPDTFMDDLSGAYAEDMSIPDAKIQVLMSENAALTAQVNELKAHNYDLLMSAPSTDMQVEEEAPEGADDSDNDGDDEGVESLFGGDKSDNEDKDED